MGDTHAIGMGYGTVYTRTKALEEKLEEAIDIEFLLEDEYPLLVDHGAGNAWHHSVTTMVFIKATTHHDYSFLIEANTINTGIPQEGIDQLRSFCNKFDIPFRPSWKIFSYIG
jgi:hypothetical protein